MCSCLVSVNSTSLYARTRAPIVRSLVLFSCVSEQHVSVCEDPSAHREVPGAHVLLNSTSLYARTRAPIVRSLVLMSCVSEQHVSVCEDTSAHREVPGAHVLCQ
ncbi:hypothetical protein NDU88_000429 [Pleurodeles waltl]|uniref:Secreted protein n=1 Tax=Pleurodeles waltl TaxID=8319 RepID=A0AAV7R463_PLEWA|nr:hypothetical protein NDU88_000429 [Pleurodeles waltl]